MWRNKMLGMKRLTVAFILSALIFPLVAPAKEKEEEKDPFYPSGDRPAVQSAAPDQDWGRDPFANPLAGRTQAGKASASGTGSVGLTGIIYSKKARVAIIGGEVVREGSMVLGKKLVDIRRKSIVLMDDSGRYEEIFIEDFAIGR